MSNRQLVCEVRNGQWTERCYKLADNRTELETEACLDGRLIVISGRELNFHREGIVSVQILLPDLELIAFHYNKHFKTEGVPSTPMPAVAKCIYDLQQAFEQRYRNQPDYKKAA